MYPELQKELETFERRTPKSAEAHKRNLKRLPLGVASNYRAYDPYPIFVKEGQGAHFRDLDGNDYVDHNLCFGALMAGHCHPAVVKAIQEQAPRGTHFGACHELEVRWAELICKLVPSAEMVRFTMSGTEATHLALRIAKEPFMRMVREFPNISVAIMQELAHRLDAVNNQLRAVMAENKRLREQGGLAA